MRKRIEGKFYAMDDANNSYIATFGQHGGQLYAIADRLTKKKLHRFHREMVTFVITADGRAKQIRLR